MAPVKPARMTKQESVYLQIRERILSGAFGPGYRVVIDSLAAEYAVSALPVREAVRRLEAEGLVIYRPNVGAQVAPADPGLFDEEMTILALLEGYAAALAAPTLAQEDIDRLRSINRQMAAAMETLDTLLFGRLNQEFHGVLYEHCPNASLVETVRDVSRRLDAIRRTVFVQIPYRGAASVQEHERLVDLMAEGASPAKIERAAREHKLRTAESFRHWRAEHMGAEQA